MLSLSLAILVPSLTGDLLGNIALNDVALIITFKDDPEFGVLNHSGYPTKASKQIK